MFPNGRLGMRVLLTLLLLLPVAALAAPVQVMSLHFAPAANPTRLIFDLTAPAAFISSVMVCLSRDGGFDGSSVGVALDLSVEQRHQLAPVLVERVQALGVDLVAPLAETDIDDAPHPGRRAAEHHYPVAEVDQI